LRLRGEDVWGVEIDVVQDKSVNYPEDAGDHLVQGSGFQGERCVVSS